MQDYSTLTENEAKRLVMATQVQVLRLERELEGYDASSSCAVFSSVLARMLLACICVVSRVCCGVCERASNHISIYLSLCVFV